MLRALLLSLALLAPPLLAEPLRTLSWQELIPEGAPPPPPPQAFHDLSQLADALAAESGPAAPRSSCRGSVISGVDRMRPEYRYSRRWLFLALVLVR